ncbi:hypothetical protein BLOT_009996 [Blomia tropicalis]|nr:hypothetical protein BLOT_009996 [Blomia tropicalis]
MDVLTFFHLVKVNILTQMWFDVTDLDWKQPLMDMEASSSDWLTTIQYFISINVIKKLQNI